MHVSHDDRVAFGVEGTECVGECRDRRPAGNFTSASLPSIRRLMNTDSHDFVTVDLRGLKAALVAHAQAERVSVSVLVRGAVARGLGLAKAAADQQVASAGATSGAASVKLSIRMKPEEAEQLASGARSGAVARRLSVGADCQCAGVDKRCQALSMPALETSCMDHRLARSM